MNEFAYLSPLLVKVAILEKFIMISLPYFPTSKIHRMPKTFIPLRMKILNITMPCFHDYLILNIFEPPEKYMQKVKIYVYVLFFFHNFF